MSEPLSIFNVGEHAAELNQAMFAPKQQSNLFDPRVKQAGEELVFVIRPMPYVHDVKKSMVSKNFYALTDGGGTFFFDSMTTFNNRAANEFKFCPVSDLWAKLHNSSNPAVMQLAGNFRMQRANYCYVMVVAFPTDPTMVGKMMPMRIPEELRKFMDKLANPTEQDIALGATAVSPFDLYNGYNLKITVKGKMVGNQLMRDWTVEKHDNKAPAIFPLAPNNQWAAINQLSQDVVMKFFNDTQTDNLEQVYGYHEPSLEVRKRTFRYMHGIVDSLPGMSDIVNGYFPDVIEAIKNETAQPAEQALPANGTNMPAAPMDPVQAALAGAQPAAPQVPQAPVVAQPATPQMQAGAQPATPQMQAGAQPSAPGIVLP